MAKKKVKKKTSVMKSGSKKLGVRKASSKKTAAKKAGSKKTGEKKAAVKKSNSKKIGGKKTSVKKSGAKKVTSKKTSAKKTSAKKASAKKAGSKKTSAKKVGSKKATSQKPSASRASTPQVLVGQTVKDFSLEATGEKTFNLSENLGKVIVLFFYPKDSTPGCTIEGQDFTRLHEDFKNNNAEVYGVSRDNMKSHEKFKEKQNYSIDLLSDSEEKACRYFGVIKEKNMYGRMVLGIERSTFVIDQKGQLVKEWRKVSIPGHAEEVLEFVKSL